MKRRRGAQGQVLFIFIGALAIILGIGALVIDLGFVFMIRRAEQNAADSAAIAAGQFIRHGPSQTPDTVLMRRAACFHARTNGFFILATDDSGCVPANDVNGAVLTVNYPPSSSAGTFSGRDGFVEVIISRDHRTFLAGAIGIPRLGVASSAVAAFSDGDSNTSSLVALDPRTCAAGKIHGTGDVTIHPLIPGTAGGYVHINSTCANDTSSVGCDNSGQGALDVVGQGTLTATEINITGTCKASGVVYPPPNEGEVQIGDPLGELPEPNISEYSAAGCGDGGPPTAPSGPNYGCRFTTSVTLDPGIYYGGWDVKNSASLTLNPGVYIIEGGGIKVTGSGSIASIEGASGLPAPVFFFNTDNPDTGTGQADVDLNATGTLRLRAINSGPWKGILFWNDGKGSNPGAQVFLGGQATLDIAGTIYNPWGQVKMEGGGGTGSSFASVQIIAYTFDVGGNNDLDMPYDASQLYQFDQKGLVH